MSDRAILLDYKRRDERSPTSAAHTQLSMLYVFKLTIPILAALSCLGRVNPTPPSGRSPPEVHQPVAGPDGCMFVGQSFQRAMSLIYIHFSTTLDMNGT